MMRPGFLGEWRSRFRGKADIELQVKPAGLVENDPGCVKTMLAAAMILS
jgi:hypothetical protein